MPIIPGPAALHPPCVMMRGVYGELGVHLWMEVITLMILRMLHTVLDHTSLHFLPHELGASALGSLVVRAETPGRVKHV